MSTSIQRFSVGQRIEHVAMMLMFSLLCLTGFPQRFFSVATSQTIVDALGGIGMTRLIHRVTGVLFSLQAAWHLGSAVLAIFRRKSTLSMVPSRKDFTDAITTLRYYLGKSPTHARFGRFDYRQKFEYWGLVFGTILMVFTGLVLLFPFATANLLPAQIIPASKVAHGSEGIMAFLVVIIWHIYNAHLSPDVFPFDTSIFTGKISRERMEHEHPLELEQIDARAAAPAEVVALAVSPPSELAPAPAALVEPVPPPPPLGPGGRA